MAQKLISDNSPPEKWGNEPQAQPADQPAEKPVIQPGLSLAEALGEYLETRKWSEATRNTHGPTLGQLVDFAEQNHWPPVGQLNQRHLRQYMTYLSERPKWFGKRGVRDGVPQKISPGHYDTVYRRLRTFFYFLLHDEEIPQNWMLKVDRPKLPEPLKETITKAEIDRLMAVTDPSKARSTREHFHMTRDQAVFWFFIDTSARRSGLSTCQLEELDLDEGRITVEEKGSKERYLSFGRSAIKALRAYLVLRGKLHPWTGNLWVNEFGDPMGPNWVYQMIKRRSKQAGIKGLHPHLFRHTYITHMVESNVNQTMIEKMCGVTKIPKTYLTHIGWEQIRDTHRRFSPGDAYAREKRRGSRG